MRSTYMFVSVLERQRAILEYRHHHTVVWQRYCRKVTFLVVLAGMCVTWLHSRGNESLWT